MPSQDKASTNRMEADVLQALLSGTESALPIHWVQGDDLCDCMEERIGEWTNPYTGHTLQVRLCCIWKKIYAMFPQFVQDVPAYYNVNLNEWVKTPAEWDSEDMDMPLGLWYRQVARQTGKPLSQVRAELKGKDDLRPKKVEKGLGWESRGQPDPERVERSHMERLEQSGWNIEDYIAVRAKQKAEEEARHREQQVDN